MLCQAGTSLDELPGHYQKFSPFPTFPFSDFCLGGGPFLARTWSTRSSTWSCGRSLRNSRASGPCAVPWHLSASSSEGSKISTVTRAVSVRRDWRLQDNARAEDRLATKRCDVDTKPLPARHITVNDYSPAIRVLMSNMLQGHSYQSDCGLSTDDNYAACLSPSHGSQSATHARRR